MNFLFLLFFSFITTQEVEHTGNTGNADNIVVIGKKSAESSAKSEKSSFTAVKSVSEILSGGEEAGDILAKAPGVSAFSSGGFGQLSFISLRGSSSSQVAFFLDGYPLNSGGETSIDLNSFPLSGLSSVEIFKSTLPAELGIFGMGGGVNFIPDFKKGNSSVVRYTLGSFATWKWNVSVKNRFLNIPFFLSLGGFSSAGDYEYFNNAGTEYDKKDDRVIKRSNNTVNKLFFTFGAAKRIFDYGKIKLYVYGLTNKAGIPGAGSIITKHSYYKNNRVGGICKYIFKYGSYKSDSGINSGFSNSVYYDAYGEAGIGTPISESKIINLNIKSNHHFKILKKNLISVLFGFQYENFNNDTMSEVHRKITNGALRYRYDADNTFLQSTAHFSISDNFLHNLYGFKIGGRQKIYKSVFFKSNIGKYYRLPSFWELYGNIGALKGNPDLSEEESVNLDAGFSYKTTFGFLKIKHEVAFFRNKISNLIQFIPNSQFVSVATNIGKAEITGAESSVSLKWKKTLKADFAFTYMNALNKSDISYQYDKHLPARPVIQTSLDISYLFFNPKFFAKLRWNMNYMHGAFYDAAERKPVPDRVNHNFYVQFLPKHWKGVSIKLEILNIFNKIKEELDFVPERTTPPYKYPLAVSSYLGYPIPGRSIFVTVTLTP